MVEVFGASLAFLPESINAHTDIGFGRWESYSPILFFLFYWLELLVMFTSLEAVLLKIGKGIESWFGNYIPKGVG